MTPCVHVRIQTCTSNIKMYYLRRQSIPNRCMTILLSKFNGGQRPWYRERLARQYFIIIHNVHPRTLYAPRFQVWVGIYSICRSAIAVNWQITTCITNLFSCCPDYKIERDNATILWYVFIACQWNILLYSYIQNKFVIILCKFTLYKSNAHHKRL